MECVCLKYDVYNENSSEFVRSFMQDGVRFFTRASLLWSDINKRCNNYSGKNPRYTDVNNQFLDFQDFAEWANSEFGYREEEKSGRLWAIDKDIMLQGNKNYCAELCMFVPMQVNGLFVSNAKGRGNLPIGVSMDRNSIKASCRDYIGGKSFSIHLGMYKDFDSAHKAWQLKKVQVIRNTAKEFSYHKKLYYALLQRAQDVEDDYNNNRQTMWE